MTCFGAGKEAAKGQAKKNAAVPAAGGGLQGTKHRSQSHEAVTTANSLYEKAMDHEVAKVSTFSASI